MRFSDYIVYVDESGDHNLSVISPHYPVFVLAFCVFEKASYIEATVPAFQRLKFKWFGHDAVVFHEREMRQQKPPFAFLQNRDRRDDFMTDLNEPHRVCRRLLLLSKMEHHEQNNEQIFP
ncbi:DUF3800 domain-containing protein [Martelella sp. FLE1502]